MSLPKLLICGHARHGKDEAASYLEKAYNFKFKSSSLFAIEKACFEVLKDKYGYATEMDCYNDRHNHREELFNLIREYNTPDLSRLGKELFNEYDIYVGLRNRNEFLALREQDVFDYSIWIDRSLHVPDESIKSMTILQSDCDFIINNNDVIPKLYFELEKVITKIKSLGFTK
jgi:hypothetical protein